jgi:pilus assembly protein CpaF
VIQASALSEPTGDRSHLTDQTLPRTTTLNGLVAELRTAVAGELHTESLGDLRFEDRRELARNMTLSRLRRRDADLVAAGSQPLDAVAEQQITQSVLDALFGLGRLQTLVDDERIENVDVNGCDQVWVTYADGSKVQVDPVADSDEELVEILRAAAARFGLSERRFDQSHPELDLRLPDGSRLSALMAVVARPSISIRRHRFVDLTMRDLVTLGTVDDVTASFLTAAVQARKNIVVAGAMNSGKTTLIRALASEIPPRERVVTIEQAFELGLDSMSTRHPDLVALEAREANMEGEGAIGMATLVRRALRMNADRVIVGEVLGDEVIPMLNAMSQGRAGSMCTIHADSSAGVFRRFASYAVQAPEHLPLEATTLLVAGAVHFVVFLDVGERQRAGTADGQWSTPLPDEAPLRVGPGRVFRPLLRRRFVSSIREVVDADGMQVVSNEVFRPGRDLRAIPGAPLRSGTLKELTRFGYDPRFSPGDLSWQ